VLQGIQITLARIALGWSQQRLADAARIGIATVQRAGRAGRAGRPPITVSNLFAIQTALERAGIVQGCASARGGRNEAGA
jgi:transcriptional regulator with XRE-family HTH domain